MKKKTADVTDFGILWSAQKKNMKFSEQCSK